MGATKNNSGKGILQLKLMIIPNLFWIIYRYTKQAQLNIRQHCRQSEVFSSMPYLQFVQILKKYSSLESMSKNKTLSLHKINELPFTCYPSLAFPSFFYKVKNRIGPSHSIILVGLQLHVMKRFEEDHIMQIFQIFNYQCPRIKLHIIQPSLIYGEFRIDIDETYENNQEFAELQAKLFQLLRHARSQLEEYFKIYLNEHFLLSKQYDSQRLIHNFQDDVVEKVKQKETNIFSNHQFYQK